MSLETEVRKLRQRVRQLEQQTDSAREATFVYELTAGESAEPRGFANAVSASNQQLAAERRTAALQYVRQHPSEFQNCFAGSHLFRQFPGLSVAEADQIVRQGLNE
jgi:hypothetical protein